jgi:hypothetical protein
MSDDLPEPLASDVEASRGDGRFTVAEYRWKKLLPELPDEVIELLATPVVVSVDRLDGQRGHPSGRPSAEDVVDAWSAAGVPTGTPLKAPGYRRFAARFVAPVGARGR